MQSEPTQQHEAAIAEWRTPREFISLAESLAPDTNVRDIYAMNSELYDRKLCADCVEELNKVLVALAEYKKAQHKSKRNVVLFCEFMEYDEIAIVMLLALHIPFASVCHVTKEQSLAEVETIVIEFPCKTEELYTINWE